MPIEATEPTTLSATYDKWAFIFQTQGFGLAEPGSDEIGKISAYATLVKYRIREDGIPERSPLASDQVDIGVSDLYALMATDADVAAAFTALVTAVQKIAQSQGAL